MDTSALRCQVVLAALFVQYTAAFRQAGVSVQLHAFEDASGSCGGRQCTLQGAQWTLKDNGTYWPGLRASSGLVYELHVSHNCNGERLRWQGLEEAHIVPIIDAQDPSGQSRWHVQMNPTLLHTLWLRKKRGQELRVCEFDKRADRAATGHKYMPGTCFCKLQLPNRPAFSLVRLPWVPTSILAVLSRLHGGSLDGTPFWRELIFVWIPFVSFLVIHAYVLWCIWRSRQRHAPPPSDSPSQEEEGSEDREQETSQVSEIGIRSAIIILTPWKLFCGLSLRLVGVVLMIITFLALLVQFITPVFRPEAIYAIMGLLFLFSLCVIVQAVVVSAQQELLHAVLSHGYAVTPESARTGAHWRTWVITGLAIIMLVACGLWADFINFTKDDQNRGLLFTASLALAGPLGKIIREHFQNLAVHRETMQCEAMCSIHSLAGLFTQGQSHCEDDCRSGLETKLSSGKLRFVDLDALIKAGRSQTGILEACEASDASADASSTSQVSYGILDLRWHGCGIYELRGSRWAFCKLPLLAAAVSAIYVAYLAQYLSYSNLVPELEMLSLQAAGAEFKFTPWVYEYTVELDTSFRAVEVTCGFKEQVIRAVVLDDGRSCSRRYVSSGRREEFLLDGSFPYAITIQVESVLGTLRNYTLQILPSRTVASRALIQPITSSTVDTRKQDLNHARRCVSFINLRSSVLGIPKASTSVVMSMKLVHYTFTVPVLPCSPDEKSLRAGSVLTAHCMLKLGKDEKAGPQACREYCRLRGDCLDSFPGKAGGCFFMILPPQSICREAELDWAHRASTRDAGNTVAGSLCFADDCKIAQVNNSEIEFPLMPLDPRADDFKFVLTLALSPTKQQLDSIVEHIHLCRGPAAPVEMLAEVEVAWRDGAHQRLIDDKPAVERDGHHYIINLPFVNPLSIHFPLLLYLVPLVPDPDAAISWDDVALGNGDSSTGDDMKQSNMSFSQCKDNRYLSNHFTVCPYKNWTLNAERWGSWADVRGIELDPWNPRLLQEVVFNVTCKQVPAMEPRSFRIKVQLASEVQSPAWRAIFNPVSALLQRDLAHCQVPWPDQHMLALLNDVECLCRLARESCTLNVTVEPWQLGPMTELRERILAPLDVLRVGVSHALQHNHRHNALRLLSCSWSLDWPRGSVNPPAEFARPIWSESSAHRKDILKVDAGKFSKPFGVAFALQSNDVDMLRALCEDEKVDSCDSSIKTTLAEDIIDALESNVYVTDEMLQVIVHCVATTKHPRSFFKSLSAYASRTARWLDVAQQLNSTEDRTWQEAWASSMIESGCTRCIRLLPVQSSISHLGLEISRYSAQAAFSSFDDMVDRLNLRLFSNLSLAMDYNNSTRIDPLDISSVNQFGAIMKKLEHLQDLRLQQVTAWHVAIWLTCKNVTGLRSLLIQNVSDWLGDDVVKMLGQAVIAEGKTLDQLSLQNVHFDLKLLANTLLPGDAAGLRLSLRVLDLHGYVFKRSGFGALSALLHALPRLTELYLSEADIRNPLSNARLQKLRNDGMSDVLYALDSKSKQIEAIDLWNVKGLLQKHIEALLVALTYAPKLRILRVSSYMIRAMMHLYHISNMTISCDDVVGQEMSKFNDMLIAHFRKAHWPNIEEVAAYCPRKVNLANFITHEKQVVPEDYSYDDICACSVLHENWMISPDWK